MAVFGYFINYYVYILILSMVVINNAQHEGKCEPITLSICKGIQYNVTIFPNILGHQDQSEAGLQLNQFYPLVKVGCSPTLQLFLCSVYTPICSTYNRAFPPCRHMCEEAKACEKLMKKFDFSWPRDLDCSKFPLKTEGDLCFGRDIIPSTITPSYVDRRQCLPGVGFSCPAHMTVHENDISYEFMDTENCGAPCDSNRLMFWTEGEKQFANLWIGCWSFICVISTLFTVLTYLIDMPRFLYPERPIIFLSGCYLVVAIAYIVGFFLRDSVACKQFPSSTCSADNTLSTCPKVVTQGAREAGCTVLFMMVYFFSMASSIWWVVLTITWFLAAGLKWGNEAIEAKSPYFHGTAWSLPAIQTVIVLISSKIEGDLLSGVCFVGVYNTKHLLWFLLVPLSIYLLVGTCFLVAGFVAMFNIRNVVKHNGGTGKVEKLERLMVRIGVFSVLYTVPATVMIACYFYEQMNRDSWQKGWFAENCRKFRVPCPCEYSKHVGNKPDFIVFIIKYFVMLIVGITSGFWIWSSKTVESWANFKDNLCCFKSSTQRVAGYQRGAPNTNTALQSGTLPHCTDALQPLYQTAQHSA
ncbi:frizzled receptor isoform X1 [Ciona intestinalis]